MRLKLTSSRPSSRNGATSPSNFHGGGSGGRSSTAQSALDEYAHDMIGNSEGEFFPSGDSQFQQKHQHHHASSSRSKAATSSSQRQQHHSSKVEGATSTALVVSDRKSDPFALQPSDYANGAAAAGEAFFATSAARDFLAPPQPTAPPPATSGRKSRRGRKNRLAASAAAAAAVAPAPAPSPLLSNTTSSSSGSGNVEPTSLDRLWSMEAEVGEDHHLVSTASFGEAPGGGVAPPILATSASLSSTPLPEIPEHDDDIPHDDLRLGSAGVAVSSSSGSEFLFSGSSSSFATNNAFRKLGAQDAQKMSNVPLGRPTHLHVMIQTQSWELLREKLKIGPTSSAVEDLDELLKPPPPPESAPSPTSHRGRLLKRAFGGGGPSSSAHKSKGDPASTESLLQSEPSSPPPVTSSKSARIADRDISQAHFVARDEQGRTPLHLVLQRYTDGSLVRGTLALQRAPTDVILALIAAEPRAALVADVEGVLPLVVATREGHCMDVVRLLVETFPDQAAGALSHAVDHVCLAIERDRHERRKWESKARRATNSKKKGASNQSEVLLLEQDDYQSDMALYEHWQVVELLAQHAAALEDEAAMVNAVVPLFANPPGATNSNTTTAVLDEPLLSKVLTACGPETVVSLLIPPTKPYFASGDGLNDACAALYLAIANHYSLDVLQSLVTICPLQACVVRDETGMGLISASYVVWTYGQHGSGASSMSSSSNTANPGAASPPPAAVAARTTAAQIKQHRESMKIVIRRGIQSSQLKSEHRREFLDWWAKMKFWIHYHQLAGRPVHPREHSLHTALWNPDTPPQVVALLLALDKQQARVGSVGKYEATADAANKNTDGGAGAGDDMTTVSRLLPLHIACITGTYTPRHYESLSMRKTVIALVLRAYPDAARVLTPDRRLPLHLALAEGRKTWFEGIEALVTEEPRALRVRDSVGGPQHPTVRLLPFQMAALTKRAWTDEGKVRFAYMARNKFTHRQWRSMTMTERAAEVVEVQSKYDMDAIDTAYQLLRADPSVLDWSIPSKRRKKSSRREEQMLPEEGEIVPANPDGSLNSAWLHPPTEEEKRRNRNRSAPPSGSYSPADPIAMGHDQFESLPVPPSSGASNLRPTPQSEDGSQVVVVRENSGHMMRKSSKWVIEEGDKGLRHSKNGIETPEPDFPLQLESPNEAWQQQRQQQRELHGHRLSPTADDQQMAALYDAAAAASREADGKSKEEMEEELERLRRRVDELIQKNDELEGENGRLREVVWGANGILAKGGEEETTTTSAPKPRNSPTPSEQQHLQFVVEEDGRARIKAMTGRELSMSNFSDLTGPNTSVGGATAAQDDAKTDDVDNDDVDSMSYLRRSSAVSTSVSKPEEEDEGTSAIDSSTDTKERSQTRDNAGQTWVAEGEDASMWIHNYDHGHVYTTTKTDDGDVPKEKPSKTSTDPAQQQWVAEGEDASLWMHPYDHGHIYPSNDAAADTERKAVPAQGEEPPPTPVADDATGEKVSDSRRNSNTSRLDISIVSADFEDEDRQAGAGKKDEDDGVQGDADGDDGVQDDADGEAGGDEEEDADGIQDEDDDKDNDDDNANDIEDEHGDADNEHKNDDKGNLLESSSSAEKEPEDPSTVEPRNETSDAKNDNDSKDDQKEELEEESAGKRRFHFLSPFALRRRTSNELGVDQAPPFAPPMEALMPARLVRFRSHPDLSSDRYQLFQDEDDARNFMYQQTQPLPSPKKSHIYDVTAYVQQQMKAGSKTGGNTVVNRETPLSPPPLVPPAPQPIVGSSDLDDDDDNDDDEEEDGDGEETSTASSLLPGTAVAAPTAAPESVDNSNNTEKDIYDLWQDLYNFESPVVSKKNLSTPATSQKQAEF